MAIQTRGTFIELSDNIDKTIYTLLFDARKALPNRWRQSIQEKKSKKRFERTLGVVGIGDIPEKGEGAAYISSPITRGGSCSPATTSRRSARRSSTTTASARSSPRMA
jgi:hypothetical protein